MMFCAAHAAAQSDSLAASFDESLRATSSVRIESTAPEFGWSSVRFYGQSGQHTLLLIDGLPLWGFGLTGRNPAHLPALDVGRVEILEGPATARFGLSALGGMVNVVPREPSGLREIVVSGSTPTATSGAAWLSQRAGKHVGLSLLVGGHVDQPRDRDGDGWIDIARTRHILLRPRVQVSSSRFALRATAGLQWGTDDGGTAQGAVLETTGEAYPIRARASRVDGGLVLSLPARGRDTLTFRVAATSEVADQDFGPASVRSEQRGHQRTVFGEVTFVLPLGRSRWLAGAAASQEEFRSPNLDGFDYDFTTLSLFVESTIRLGSRATLVVNGRCDRHNRYGAYCAPRASVGLGSQRPWGARVTVASGAFAPTPFIDETQGVVLERLVPFASPTIAIGRPTLCAGDSVQTTAPLTIRAERAVFGSLDVTRRAGRLELSAGIFGSTIEHRFVLWELNIFEERPQLINVPGPKRSLGTRFLARYSHGPAGIAMAYVYLRSTLAYRSASDRIESPLTPRHSAEAEAWWQPASRSVVRLQVSYTGRQTVVDDPYRGSAPAYATIDLHVSQRIAGADLYLDAANLSDVRQTRHDPLLMQAPDGTGRWTTPIWAPLAGRILRAGVALRF
jgi:iron complex outermembrane receptor protein